MPRVTGRSAWAKGPARGTRRNAWERRPRSSATYSADAGLEPELEDPARTSTGAASNVPVREPCMSQADMWHGIWLLRAQRMWSTDYTVWLRQEKLEVPELRAKVEQVFAAQVSSYRKRLTNERLIIKYDEKTERMIRDTTAVARRRANQLDIPFSVFARSGSYFNQRIATRAWKDNQRGLRIIHRAKVKQLLEYMLLTEPAPGFIPSPFISCFGVDQCNMWQAAAHSKKGHFRGAERLNSQGMPVSIRSETVLNIVERVVPITAPLLNGADVKLITEEGPYTEDWHNLLPVLNPTEVERTKWEWAEQVMARLERRNNPPLQPEVPSTELEVVLRCLGKPREKPNGPSAMKIHTPIPKCETQSHDDAFKLLARLLILCKQTTLCIIVFCDGQLVELLRACKMRWPAEFKRILIGNGFFHSFAHFCFCLIYGWWGAVLCTFASWLHKDKQIYQNMKDLQNDNAKHALDFLRTSTAAILAYLILDVKHPSPALLLRDPRGYLASVRHEGGIVILMFLFCAGIPVLTFQYATRAADGASLTQCLAYAFHVFRSYVPEMWLCMPHMPEQ